MPTHSFLTISLGDIITVVAILGGIWRVEKFFSKFLIEHEILVRWYCKEQGIELHELPTRTMR